jgi:hypothetical protein
MVLERPLRQSICNQLWEAVPPGVITCLSYSLDKVIELFSGTKPYLVRNAQAQNRPIDSLQSRVRKIESSYRSKVTPGLGSG